MPAVLTNRCCFGTGIRGGLPVQNGLHEGAEGEGLSLVGVEAVQRVRPAGRVSRLAIRAATTHRAAIRSLVALFCSFRSLRRSLGWQMENIAFPPAHTFVFNKLALEFVEQRREELNNYWQTVLQIDRITEFTKHHCSEELKAFLEVEQAFTSSHFVVDGVSDDEAAPAAAASAAADGKEGEKDKRKSLAKRQSMKGSRRSLAAQKKSMSSASLKAPLSAATLNGDSADGYPSTIVAPVSMPAVAEAETAFPAAAEPTPPLVPTAHPAATVTSSKPPVDAGRASLLAQINARRVD